MRDLQRLSIRNFSDGIWRGIQNIIAPIASYKNGINFDSDIKMASLTIRKGIERINDQLVAGESFYGIYQHIEQDSTNNVLFAVAGDGKIYDVEDGTESLTGDTPEQRTRFITYLGETVRFNGTDARKSWDGTTWSTTGGGFDLANMPNLSLGIEWRDRVYGVDLANPDTLLYSSIADYATKQISWTVDNGSIVMEREDGGGGITALTKIPGYLLVFKRHTMKRWNGSSTYPDDLINIGTPSQEAVCVGRGTAMFLNGNGIWATNGGYPQRISRPVQDIVEAIDSTYLDKVTAYCNDIYAQWSIGSVTIDGITHRNVVLKFNLDDNSWNIRKYNEVVEFPSLYVKDNTRRVACGNDDGEVFIMDEGTTDNGKAIPFQLDFQPNDFGVRGRTKTLKMLSLFLKGAMTAHISVRTDLDSAADYTTPHQLEIGDAVTNVSGINARGNVFDIRLAGTSNSGGVVFDGMEFDERGVQLNETRK